MIINKGEGETRPVMHQNTSKIVFVPNAEKDVSICGISIIVFLCFFLFFGVTSIQV